MGKKKHKLFGVAMKPDLDEAPDYLELWLGFLQEKGMEVEGLFRVSGSVNNIKRLREQVDDSGFETMNMEEASPHDIAGLTKLYFRELPDPLFTFELYDSFIGAGMGPRLIVNITNSLLHSVTEGEAEIAQALSFLPPTNKVVLRRLLEFLHEMVKYRDKNKMSPENLATCLVPNLLRPKIDTMDGAIADYPYQISLFSMLIDKYPQFFQIDIEEATKRKERQKEKALAFKAAMENRYKNGVHDEGSATHDSKEHKESKEKRKAEKLEKRAIKEKERREEKEREKEQKEREKELKEKEKEAKHKEKERKEEAKKEEKEKKKELKQKEKQEKKEKKEKHKEHKDNKEGSGTKEVGHKEEDSDSGSEEDTPATEAPVPTEEESKFRVKMGNKYQVIRQNTHRRMEQHRKLVTAMEFKQLLEDRLPRDEEESTQSEDSAASTGAASASGSTSEETVFTRRKITSGERPLQTKIGDARSPAIPRVITTEKADINQTWPPKNQSVLDKTSVTRKVIGSIPPDKRQPNDTQCEYVDESESAEWNED